MRSQVDLLKYAWCACSSHWCFDAS